MLIAYRRSLPGVMTLDLLVPPKEALPAGRGLFAHFHSHPGNGPGATHPSGTDENFQRRLERAGHLAPMAIFSRDGYVRFVRLDQNFEIEIYGECAPDIYRLQNLD